MRLSELDVAKFYVLHKQLMHFVNQRLQIAPEAKDVDAIGELPPTSRLQLREAVLSDPGLLQSFVDESGIVAPPDMLNIVLSWKHAIPGKFIMLRQTKTHAALLLPGPDAKVFAVTGLIDTITDLVGDQFPMMVTTVLLPFGDKIVYDGLIESFPVLLGPGFRKIFLEEEKKALKQHGLITALPISKALPSTSTEDRSVVKKKSPQRKRKGPAKENDPAVVPLIRDMVDRFCAEHLDEEYRTLCHKLLDTLARKKPSPLLSGKPNTWAGAIVRTIGHVNYLDDKKAKPHMKLTAIDKEFGVAESTAQAKAKLIRTMLRIGQFDHRWMLPSQWDSSTMIWYVDVNGMPTDMRTAPPSLQEAAFEKGLIPYIPADRKG